MRIYERKLFKASFDVNEFCMIENIVPLLCQKNIIFAVIKPGNNNNKKENLLVFEVHKTAISLHKHTSV